MKKQTKKRNYYRVYAMATMAMVMLMVGGFVVLPEIDNNSYALTCIDGVVTAVDEGDTASVGDICDTATVDVEVTVASILDITSTTINGTITDGKADLGEITPGQAGVNTNNVTVTVDTNVSAGYQLQLEGIKTVSPADAEDPDDPVALANNNALINVDTPTATIESMSGSNVAVASFPAGGWGYSIDSGAHYSAIPSSATRVVGYDWVTDKEGATTITTDTTFYFGVRPSSSQTAGTYEGGVRFTTVAGSGNGS